MGIQQSKTIQILTSIDYYLMNDNLDKINEALDNLRILKSNFPTQKFCLITQYINQIDKKLENQKNKYYFIKELSKPISNSKINEKPEDFIDNIDLLYSYYSQALEVIFNICPKSRIVNKNENLRTDLIKANINRIELGITAFYENLNQINHQIVSHQNNPNECISIPYCKIEILKKLKKKVERHFNLFTNDFGFKFFKVENIEVAKVLLETSENISANLRHAINNNDYNPENVSFSVLFYHLSFYLNLIEKTVNKHIEERINRLINGNLAYRNNAYYAALWYKFKITHLTEIQQDLNILIQFLDEIETRKNILLEKMQNIIDNEYFENLADKKFFSEYCSKDNSLYNILLKLY